MYSTLILLHFRSEIVEYALLYTQGENNGWLGFYSILSMQIVARPIISLAHFLGQLWMIL